MGAKKKKEYEVAVSVYINGDESEIEWRKKSEKDESCNQAIFDGCDLGDPSICRTHGTGSVEFGFEGIPACCGMNILYNLEAIRSLPDDKTVDLAIEEIQKKSDAPTIMATEVVEERHGGKPPDVTFLIRNGFVEVYRFRNRNSGNVVGVFIWDERGGKL